MILGILSDTHHDLSAVDKAFCLFRRHGASAVLCLGDVCSDMDGKAQQYAMEVVCTGGNVDASRAYPLIAVYEADGMRILMTHGHTLDVRHGHALLLKEAKLRGCQAALYGHTHIALLRKEEGVLILNPGSAAQPRGPAKASCALLDTAGGVLSARILPLDEDRG